MDGSAETDGKAEGFKVGREDEEGINVGSILGFAETDGSILILVLGCADGVQSSAQKGPSFT